MSKVFILSTHNNPDQTCLAKTVIAQSGQCNVPFNHKFKRQFHLLLLLSLSAKSGSIAEKQSKPFLRRMEENGVFPYVADEDVTAGKDIFCKICERILASNFGVIELTERNPNVMLEFGLILGNQKPVFMLYNKAIASKVSTRIPTDITSMERIEYSNQRELKEQFSKGLNAYLQKLDKNKQFGKAELLTEADAEEIDLILDALKSDSEAKRYQGILELDYLSYKRGVSKEPRLLQALENALDDNMENIRFRALETIGIILRVEDNNQKEIVSKRFINKLSCIAFEDKLSLRNKAFSVLEDTNDRKVIEISFKAIRETKEADWSQICNNVINCLRKFYHSGDRNLITREFFNIIENPSLSYRGSNTLAQVRQS